MSAPVDGETIGTTVRRKRRDIRIVNIPEIIIIGHLCDERCLFRALIL
jgi:hypothetical protein